MQWRVIGIKDYSSIENMSIDHAIYESVKNGDSMPTIRFYRWNNGGVSIGFGQNSSIVNTQECDKNNVGYVRRPTGGNVVYHHPFDVTYSVIADNHLFDKDFNNKFLKKNGVLINRAAYNTIREWIIKPIKNMGIAAESFGKNDIVVDNYKIVGNAQKVSKESFLQHGSIFYTGNGKDWCKYLNYSEDKLKNIRSISSLINSYNAHKFYKNLVDSFTLNKIVGGDFSIGTLTKKEIYRAEELAKKEYSNNFYGSGNEKKGDVCAVDIQAD